MAVVQRSTQATAELATPATRRGDPAQRQLPYVDALRAYVGVDPLRMNVPGHKGGPAAPEALVALLGEAALAVDVPPLLWGVDRGDAPTPMDRALALAADAWGAKRTWFLTNGASQGNHMTSLALRSLGSAMVVQRSVHSSVVDGLVLSGLRPVFVAPSIDGAIGVAHGVSSADLAAALQRTPDAAAALVVSPSYFGAVADVAALVAVAHEAGVPLIVDEAWGSHFGFHPDVPPSALSLGADVVISSTHKMTGGLTQAAMLHLGHGPFAAALELPLERALNAVQSTSASSLLYASLDAARHRLATAGERLLDSTLAAAARLRREIAELDHVALAEDGFRAHADVVANDPLRVVIDVRPSGWTGYAAADRLRARDGIDFEVVNAAALVAVLGAFEADAMEVDRLVAALAGLPRTAGSSTADQQWSLPPAWGEAVMAPRDAYLSPVELVPAERAVGRLSADTLAAYPPGIPNLMPGERISAEHVAFLRGTIGHGGYVRGACTAGLERMRVVVT